jgi:hypothetical protein
LGLLLGILALASFGGCVVCDNDDDDYCHDGRGGGGSGLVCMYVFMRSKVRTRSTNYLGTCPMYFVSA